MTFNPSLPCSDTINITKQRFQTIHMQLYCNLVLLDWYDITTNAALTFHTLFCEICTNMTFNHARAYVQFLSRLLLNATRILSIFWIVSVNLMAIIWSEDDTERSICLYLFYLHVVDICPNSETKGLFQTWHPPLLV